METGTEFQNNRYDKTAPDRYGKTEVKTAPDRYGKTEVKTAPDKYGKEREN